MKSITVLITEDHSMIREFWVQLLNSDQRFRVVGDCGTGEEAIRIAAAYRPEIVLMDINLPGMNGVEATEKLLQVSPNSKVLGVSLHNNPAYAQKMVQKGAVGYITKNSSRDELMIAIFSAHKGDRYICEEIKDNLSEMIFNGNEGPKLLSKLSQRELEVAYLIKDGHSSKDIACKFSLSVKTVEVHRHNILR
jgi:DNA-binding NarL/FixJ family response regulator